MAERLKARLLDSQRLADLVVGPDAYRDLPRILAAVQVSDNFCLCLCGEGRGESSYVDLPSILAAVQVGSRGRGRRDGEGAS
jgi:hypothetical protein